VFELQLRKRSSLNLHLSLLASDMAHFILDLLRLTPTQTSMPIPVAIMGSDSHCPMDR